MRHLSILNLDAGEYGADAVDDDEISEDFIARRQSHVAASVSARRPRRNVGRHGGGADDVVAGLQGYVSTRCGGDAACIRPGLGAGQTKIKAALTAAIARARVDVARLRDQVNTAAARRANGAFANEDALPGRHVDRTFCCLNRAVQALTAAAVQKDVAGTGLHRLAGEIVTGIEAHGPTVGIRYFGIVLEGDVTSGFQRESSAAQPGALA